MSASFDQVLARGGLSGALIASLDWSRHVLGPIEGWPTQLKSALSICLSAKTPILVRWGTELIEFYNDAYHPVLGTSRHPRAMGARADEAWPETWHVLGPIFEEVFSGGAASAHRDSFMFLDRNGFQEEAYFDHAHSPLFTDDGSVAGVFSTLRETTARVLNERRLRTLKALADSAHYASDLRSAYREAAGVLYNNAADIPFCLLYTADYKLVGSAGVSDQLDAVKLPLQQVFSHGKAVIADSQIRTVQTDQDAREGRKIPQKAYLVPIRAHHSERPSAVLVVGLSPHLQFDTPYRDFLELAASQLGATLAAARARDPGFESEPTANIKLGPAAQAINRRAARAAGAESPEEHDPDLLLRAASSILQKVPMSITLVRGPDYTWELANELACRVMGEPSLVGKSARAHCAALRGGEAMLRGLDYVRASGETFRADELPLALDPNSSNESYFMVEFQPLGKRETPVDWILAVGVDVTEQVKLRRALESMSSERKRLLLQEQGARAEAESANRVKDEFLAVLGHELRNPLAPITTALSLMRQRGPLSHEALIIDRQVGHLLRLVEDLLDVSRITRGKVELKRKPLNLASVVREAVELASPLLEERQQHLSLDLPATGLDVLGDRTRLSQVLANLLTNASKYSDRGSQISVQARRIPEAHVAEISVRDHGVGIEPDMLSAVWNAFTQGAQTIDRSHGGLGLGLTIVRSLVALHGGTVAAHSDGKGKGSEFCVRLPLMPDGREDAPEPVMRPSQLPGGVFGGHKILLVDDNEDAVELLAEWFRMRGATVETALDGPSALETAKRFEPEVALLDLGLPAMNGYELARRLRAQEEHRQLLLIAVTGYGEQSARDETAAAGFDDHCVKPLDLSAFELRLRERLAQRGPSA